MKKQERELAKKFYKMLGKNENELIYHKKKFYSFEKQGYIEGIFQFKNKTLANVLKASKGNEMMNVYIAVNDFPDEPVKRNVKRGDSIQSIEYRKAIRQGDKVTRLNSFYVDIDFTNDSGEHLSGEELQEKKADVFEKLMNLSLKPSAIIESRNGFHVYYIINEEERKDVSAGRWIKQENSIYYYIRDNVSEYVDKKVRNISRVLRCPCTKHKKDDSDVFKVIVKYLSQTYSMQKIEENFSVTYVGKEDKGVAPADTLGDKLTNNLHDNDVNNIDDSLNIANNKPQKLSLFNSELLQNIMSLNVDYFDYVEKMDSVEMEWGEVENFLNKYNLMEFLRLNVNMNEPFCSLFREDKNPSCYIFLDKKQILGRYLYYDNSNKVDYSALSLIGIISYFAGIRYTQAVKFLAKVFNIKIKNTFNNTKKDIEPMIKHNIKVLQKVGESCKETRYILKLIPIYQEIMKVWKRVVNERNFNNPADANIQLASPYLSKRLCKDTKTIRNHLQVLEALNILKHIDSKAKKKKYNKGANTYLIQKLNYEKLSQAARDLKSFCKNPLGTITPEITMKFIFKSVGWEIERFSA